MIRSVLLFASLLVLIRSLAVEGGLVVYPARCGLSNGSAIADATGGSPPCSCCRTTGATSYNISGLAPGDHTISVIDGLTNTAQTTVMVEAIRSRNGAR